MRFITGMILILLSLFPAGGCLAEAGTEDPRLCCDDFKKLSNEEQITGPFSEKGIVYACAMMLHQASGLEEYRFSDEERSIYIHSHYRSPEELP